MKLSISKGNTKLGKVHNISLPPCHSCAPGVPCAEKCYARKAWVQFLETRAAWLRNWKAWTSDAMGYMETIAQHCADKRVERFRWHVAGDIPSLSYYDGMKIVAQCNPETQFLAFTKNYDAIMAPNRPSNLRLVFSMWPGLRVKGLTQDEMLRNVSTAASVAWMVPAVESTDDWYNEQLKSDVNAHSLACSGHCDKCFMCWYMESGSFVAFHEH